MRYRVALPVLLSACIAGCTTITPSRTPGERVSGFGYVPLDPLPIDQAKGADSCAIRETTVVTSANAEDAVARVDGLLAKLPDQTIRFAVASFDQTKGSLTFGPATLTAKGSQYRAVLDYIQADAVPVQFWIKRLSSVELVDASKPIIQATVGPDGRAAAGYDVVTSVAQSSDFEPELHPGYGPDKLAAMRAEVLRIEAAERTAAGYQEVTIPVYVGVGLRLSADILALKSGVSLSGLSAIGVEAEANRLNGTLTVQSLGVSGKAIATALPLPNKLDQTTIESAILAVGTMRATLYATSEKDGGVYLQPRIVGLYSPVEADPLLINAIYSELSRQRPRWRAPCRE